MKKIIKLKKACDICPEQWECETEDGGRIHDITIFFSAECADGKFDTAYRSAT